MPNNLGYLSDISAIAPGRRQDHRDGHHRPPADPRRGRWLPPCLGRGAGADEGGGGGVSAGVGCWCGCWWKRGAAGSPPAPSQVGFVHSRTQGLRHAQGWRHRPRLHPRIRQRRHHQQRRACGQALRDLLLSEGRHVRLHQGGLLLPRPAAGFQQARRAGVRGQPGRCQGACEVRQEVRAQLPAAGRSGQAAAAGLRRVGRKEHVRAHLHGRAARHIHCRCRRKNRARVAEGEAGRARRRSAGGAERLSA